MSNTKFACLVFVLTFSLSTLASHTNVAWDEVSAAPQAGASIESDLPAGHSQHGEAFNEGPRQRAYLMGGTGPIRFPVTSDVPDVQKFVEQGIGQVHGYWYFEAERSFRQAALLDPNCPIAYWGMALANANNSKRAKQFIAQAVQRRENASSREAMYIDALSDYLNDGSNRKQRSTNLAAAYEKLMHAFPDDLEAKAFYAHALYQHRSDLKRSHEEVDQALKQVLTIEPMHPVHHFRVHNWDTKDARRALDSASLCGQSAPRIAHMWHMPGHIYSRLKRYEDAVWQQEASARVDHAQMMRDRILPDQIHNFAHNNEWFVRSLTYVGRWQDALDLARNMVELPQHPRYNTLAKRGSAYYGRLRMFDVLYEFELWNQLVDLANGPHLPPSDRESEQIKRLRYLGVAYAETAQNKRADEVLADLRQRLVKARSNTASNRSTGRSRSRSGRGSTTKSAIEKAIAAIQGHQAAAASDYSEAVDQLRKAGEDKLVLARMQCMSGDVEQAVADAASYVRSQQHRVRPLAGYVEILWLAGQRDEAAKELEKLRQISGSIQFGSPVFDRLTPIADQLVLPADWRLKSKPPEDTGERPDLSSLGPFRWQPTPAEDWVLPDHRGRSLALKHYQGQPIVAIFYLGYGCLHCAEQLKAFAPLAEQYRDAGIEIVAISSDDQAGLQASLDNYEDEVPFPLLSDASLNVFKAYRAFDDFEQFPLHGTFLIDGDGNVRWQDVSYEPFMDAEFLLGESKRLLAQSRVDTRRKFVSEVDTSGPAAKSTRRIDPAGIDGALVLAGSDLPEDAIQQFVGMAKGTKANVIILQADDSETALHTATRLANAWSKNDGNRIQTFAGNELKRFDDADGFENVGQVTGVWIAGQSDTSLCKLVSQPSVRRLVQTVFQNGGVVGAAGNAARYLSQSVLDVENQSELSDVGLSLFPDAIIDVTAAGNDDASEHQTVDTHPRLVFYELAANAALVLRGRRMKAVGEGQVRIHLAGGRYNNARTLTLSDSQRYADLTALRLAAKDRTGPEFPPRNPAPPIVENGTLIIIGGGGMPPGIISEFVELAGGKNASIVVLPTANSDPVPSQSGIVRSFRSAGAGSVTVLPGRTLKQVESDESLDTLRNATGIWFGGGRQWRFADAYLDTKAYDLMHDVLRRGGVVMGSSAGASIQAEYLARANPLGNLDIMADGYERGMGFLKGAAVDQHFAQRRRFKDMSSLVNRYPQLLGIGIDEATAIIVQGSIATVIGRHSVHFYDRNKPVEDGAPDYESVHDGGRYDLVARKVLDPGKKAAETKAPREDDARKSAAASTQADPDTQGRDKFRRYAETMMKKYDTNGDTFLDASEYEKMRRNPSSADTNTDGKISTDELVTWLKAL